MSKYINAEELIEHAEVCEDTISRQAAIEALGEEPDIALDTEEEWAERDAWARHVRAIKSLPPAKPTPVCEDTISREWVLNEIITKVENDDSVLTAEGCYRADGWWRQFRWGCLKGDVIAWRPLPEPYRESEE